MFYDGFYDGRGEAQRGDIAAFARAAPNSELPVEASPHPRIKFMKAIAASPTASGNLLYPARRGACTEMQLIVNSPAL